VDNLIDKVLLWFILTLAIFFLLLIPITTIADSYTREAKRQACQDLGMEKKTINQFTTCVEPNGNAHIAEFTCSGSFSDTKCHVQFIKLQTFGVEING